MDERIDSDKVGMNSASPLTEIMQGVPRRTENRPHHTLDMHVDSRAAEVVDPWKLYL
jgi:hypothetical protein